MPIPILKHIYYMFACAFVCWRVLSLSTTLPTLAHIDRNKLSAYTAGSRFAETGGLRGGSTAYCVCVCGICVDALGNCAVARIKIIMPTLPFMLTASGAKLVGACRSQCVAHILPIDTHLCVRVGLCVCAHLVRAFKRSCVCIIAIPGVFIVLVNCVSRRIRSVLA